MEYIKLIGVLIVVLGFALKLDSILITVSYTHLTFYYFSAELKSGKSGEKAACS